MQGEGDDDDDDDNYDEAILSVDNADKEVDVDAEVQEQAHPGTTTTTLDPHLNNTWNSAWSAKLVPEVMGATLEIPDQKGAQEIMEETTTSSKRMW